MDTRYLTGIRGLAAVTVVVSHSAAAGFAPNDALGGGLGQYGVAIFFVLSGYLMGMLYARHEPAAHWRGYAIARGARVLPLFYAVLLVSAAATAIAGIFPINVPTDEFAMNLFLIYGSSILWTIPVEVQFYCIFVGLWFLSPRGGRWFWHGTLAASLALAAILGVNGSPIQGENRILACWQHFFIFGTVLGVAGATGGAARFIAAFEARRALLTPICLLAITLSIPGVRRALDLAVIETWRDPYIIAGTVAIFALSFGEPVARRLLSTRTMIFLGDISYSLYLTHMVAVHIVRETFEAADLPMMWTALPVVLALSIVLACATTWLYELPAKAWLMAKLKPTPRETRAG